MFERILGLVETTSDEELEELQMAIWAERMSRDVEAQEFEMLIIEAQFEAEAIAYANCLADESFTCM